MQELINIFKVPPRYYIYGFILFITLLLLMHGFINMTIWLGGV